MDPAAVSRAGPLGVENPLPRASSPVSFKLQNLEEPRARLLRPIPPAAGWHTLLKPPEAQNQGLSSCPSKPSALSFLDCRCPEQASPLAKKSTSFTMNPLWLENPFLKEPVPASLTLHGLEESRARLLYPVLSSTPQRSSSKLSDTQSTFPPGPLDICGTLASTGLPPDCSTRNEPCIPSRAPEQPQFTGEGEGKESDSADVMPQYVLTLPEDKAKEQPDEKDSFGPKMPVDGQEQDVREYKLKLLNLVCCSLVEGSESGRPAGAFYLERVCEKIAEFEPEFILKVALYARQELNIRSMANFLLAKSSHLLPCRPHLRRYFSHAVQLPSDWMGVARFYQSLAATGEALAPLPSCLRAAMTEKFRQFDAYQLAKYNTRKSRGKKRRPPKTKKKKRGSQHSRWKQHALGHHTNIVAKMDALENMFDRSSKSATKQSAAGRDLFSVKALIQRLHISEPAQHVMSLLGRKYPSDLQTFSRSRLPGPWDSTLAGTRMKLPTPHTWDRVLSQQGNNAKAWEALIDAQKLPFMAMLRNLRSIVRAQVSEKHHQRLLHRLENKESVIRSRQLPFRFLAAYKVIQQLEQQFRDKEKLIPSNGEIIQQILKEYESRLPGYQVEGLDRQDLRRFMEVPVMFWLVKRKKKELLKLKKVNYSHATLQRYRLALETAIGIAVRHNVPPISGRTLILISCDDEMRRPYTRARGLSCPSAGQKDDHKVLTRLDMAFLLGSMVYSASEQAELFLCDHSTVLSPVTMTGSVLKDVHHLQTQEIDWDNRANVSVSDILMDLVSRRQQVDTVLLLSPTSKNISQYSSYWLYRHHVAPQCLFVNVCTTLRFSYRSFDSSKDVVVCGFSEQVLRFMAEYGSSRFLEHVGKIDEIHGLPKPREAVMAKPEAGVGPLISAPQSRWRSIKVFISSTFRDMHAERDLLIRSVFPELRARAAAFCLAIEDVDLRWGITEHEAQRNKQLELCLSEVSRSHLFIGILGDRYGHIPREYALPDEPHYEWVKSYPAGRSITELEAFQFLDGCQDPSAKSRAFFYLRDPDFLSSVPEAWRADFAAESEEATDHVADLKERLENYEGLASFRRYTCQWGGVAQGRPYVKGLEDFGAKILQDVWEGLCRHFIQGDSCVNSGELEEPEESILQESFQELQQKKFCARAKLLHATADQLCRGSLYVVSGECGQGKTVFLAALAQELRAKAPRCGDPAPCYHVVAHFTGARPDQANARVMLGQLCALLRKLVKEPPTPPTSYRGLVGQFNSLLRSVAQSLKRRQSLVVLIDGADFIHAGSGQLVSDWLPEQLPQRVRLVLSVSEESALLGSLKQRKDVTVISLGPLDPTDRVVMVRKDLALYGKKLEESAFNNQMRLILFKRGSRQPLYLMLLTQDLRLFALFEQLSERIRKLPVSLPLLLQHMLGCLEQNHGQELVAVAFASLWASRDGLTERDLYAILATWKELNGADIDLEDAILAGRHAGSYPMAPFFDFLRSLRGLLGACGSPAEPPGSRLHLYGTPLRMAVERRYLKKPGLDRTAHVLLSAHFWKLSDPDGSRRFQNCEAESLTALPYHLVQSGCLSFLASLLTDLKFVSAHHRLHLLPSLSKAYALYEAAVGPEHDEAVASFRDFLQRNMGLISQDLLLLLQQAANEPDSSALCSQARVELCGNGRHFMKWINKPQEAPENKSLVLTLPTTPSSVSVSPSGSLAAVGTAKGILHLINVETGQELKSLLSDCDGISACVFLSETSVCLGAFNGRLELWSVKEGCRLLGTDAHKAQITDCCINSDLRLLATVSLDGHLKLWESARGHLTHDRDCSKPLNCATFHPVGRLVATGGWDRTVTVLDVNDMSTLSEMKGHDASVRCISFSSAGNILAAGSLAGTIYLWSWKEAVALSMFSVHSGCVSAAQFLPGGKLMTAGEDAKVQVWTGHLGQLWSTLQSSAVSPALCTAPSPDGSQLAVGHHSDDVWVYRQPWRSGATPTHCGANGVAVCSLAWLDNTFLVGGRDNGSLCVWNTSDLHPLSLRKFQGHDRAVTGLAVSGNLMASTSEDFTVRLWLTEILRSGPATDTSISPLAVLQGHTAGVMCCAFSLDGCYLATGAKDRALFLWDVRDASWKTPSLWRSLPFCHQDWISTCAWTGPMLLSGSNDCTVCLWDPQTGKRLRTFLGHQSPICGVTSENDHVISVDREGMLVAWDLQGVEKTRFLAHPDRANHCAGFKDPREEAFMLAAAGSDGTVNLWKPLTMEQPQVLAGHSAAVCGAAVSPASSSFLTIAADNTVRLWALRTEDGGVKDLAQHRGVVTALAWSPEGEFAVSGGTCGDLILWWKGKAVGTAKVGSRCISALAFTSPHTVLVASDGISLWDINTSGCHDGTSSLTHRKLLRPSMKALVLCACTPNPGGPLVLSLTDRDLLVLKPTAKDLWSIKSKQTSSYYSGGVGFGISASEEGVLHIWDSMQTPSFFKMRITQSGKLKEEQKQQHLSWNPKWPSSWITAARLVKDESLFFTDSEGALWTQTRQQQLGAEVPDNHWELKERRKIHDDKITALHILGDKMVTASHDRDVKIWDGSTVKLLGQFRCHAPISCLQPCPRADTSPLLIAGDSLGNIYFLEWTSLGA